MNEDPYLWLEDVTGERALDWVRERNAQTLAHLATGERFETMRTQIREVLDSADKLPYVRWRGELLYNFWQDGTHVRGLWRRSTVDGVRRDEWETLLDLDALAKAEGENWVWAGANELFPDNRRYLIHLSRGGADANVVREWDVELALANPSDPTAGFVRDGFTVPEAKTSVDWIDVDTIFIGTDFGPGSLTNSGYPRIVKRWRRGTPLESAETVFEGQAEDVSVHASHDPTVGFERDLVRRSITFYEQESHLLSGDGSLTLIDVPRDAWLGIERQWLLVRPRTDWALPHRSFTAGSLLAIDLALFLGGSREFTVLFAPTENTILESWHWTRHLLVLSLLRDVRSELLVLDPERDWTHAPLPGLPDEEHTGVLDTNPHHTDDILVTSTGFLSPPAMRHGTARDGVTVLRQASAFFDPDGLQVRQLWATSLDGTKIPYFHVSNPSLDGPTLLEAYGGFEVSYTPSYDGGLGRAWLTRGGGYVLANIRGGGEFGPRWHLAALREKRLRAYEDLAAVASDLVARGITTASQLGVTGGSNGGLLMGVMLTRYPSLFGAIAGAVPLLDMRRYHLLLAGASWVAEYGDPDTDDWQFIREYSPYQNASAGQEYPPVLWVTSTRDDRVHPGHARKMTARLLELGHNVTYYENIEGGHSAAADNAQLAFREALVFEFLWRHLAH